MECTTFLPKVVKSVGLALWSTAPWLGGGAFTDRVAPGFWPLPVPDFLLQYDRASQLAYWGEAARHFDQNDWLA